MGLKIALKRAVMKKVMTKRAKSAKTFDEAASEQYKLDASATSETNNSYYFTAHDEKGNGLFFRLGQRGNRTAEIWFAVRLSTGEAFVNVEKLLPIDKATATIECIKECKEWKFEFNGKVTPVHAGVGKIAERSGVDVVASWSGTFKSEDGLYEFTRDTDIGAFCKAVAAEKWTRGFSKELDKNHQTHIEQRGEIGGIFTVDGKKHTIYGFAVRDHSFGRRVWSYMNRHIWFVAALENGDTYAANHVKYPVLGVCGLSSGYKIVSGKVANVQDVDFREGAYTAEYGDKTTATIKYTQEIIFPFVFGDDAGAYIINEGMSRYEIFDSRVSLDSECVRGYGITEFGYNVDGGRIK